MTSTEERRQLGKLYLLRIKRRTEDNLFFTRYWVATEQVSKSSLALRSSCHSNFLLNLFAKRGRVGPSCNVIRGTTVRILNYPAEDSYYTYVKCVTEEILYICHRDCPNRLSAKQVDSFKNACQQHYLGCPKQGLTTFYGPWRIWPCTLDVVTHLNYLT